MKSYDYEACAYDGAIYCNACLPAGITTDHEDVMPVFADSEHDNYPTCDHCGARHDYVSLTRDGIAYEVQQAGIEVFEVTDYDVCAASRDSWLSEAIRDGAEVSDLTGFYWWSCQPGCLPDGEANGPFKTRQEAEDNALGF